jgi:hypothetical protein
VNINHHHATQWGKKLFPFENTCTALSATLVGVLEPSPPLLILLLLRVGGLSALSTRAFFFILKSCIIAFLPCMVLVHSLLILFPLTWPLRWHLVRSASNEAPRVMVSRYPPYIAHWPTSRYYFPINQRWVLISVVAKKGAPSCESWCRQCSIMRRHEFRVWKVTHFRLKGHVPYWQDYFKTHWI